MSTTIELPLASGGGAPTGAAGGDLGGTYPNPTVAQLTGSGGIITIPTATSISIGTNPAASGLIRFPGGATAQVAIRNNANSADIPVISTDTSNDLYINGTSAGVTTNSAPALSLCSPTTGHVYIMQAGNAVFDFNTLSSTNSMTVTNINNPVVISQAARGSDLATNNFTIQSQAPFASAVTNLAPGNIVLTIPSTVSGTGYGKVSVNVQGSEMMSLGKNVSDGNGLINAPNSLLIQTSTGGSNYFQVNSKTMFLTGTSAINLYGGGNVSLFSSSGSVGGGAGVLAIANSVTDPTSNPTGGGVMYVSSGSLAYRSPNGVQMSLGGVSGDFVSAGATTATAGLVRLAGGVSTQLAARNNANSTNLSLIATNASDVIAIGDSNNGGITLNTPGNVVGHAPAYFFENAAGSASFLTASSTSIGCAAPLQGIQVQNVPFSIGRLAKTWPSDADYTFANTEYINPIIEVSGGSLTATRAGILPNTAGAIFYVFNNTSGAQSVTFKVTGQTGVTVTNGTRATIYCNGTDYVKQS